MKNSVRRTARLIKLYGIYSLLYLVFSAGPSAIMAASNNKAIMTLKAEVSTVNEIVYVSDLVDGAPLTIASTPVLYAPKPGNRAFISVGDMRNFLARVGIHNLKTNGLQFSSLSRQSRRISPEAIKNLLKQTIAVRLNQASAHDIDLNTTTTISAVHIDKRSSAPLQIISLDINPTSGTFTAALSVADSENLAKNPISVQGRAEIVIPVLAFNQPMKRGDIIRDEHLTNINIPKIRYLKEHIISPEGMAGMELTRAHAPSQPIVNTSVRKPTAIERNELIELVYTLNNLTIKAEAKALERGAIGDTINVLNIKSGKTLQARVLGQGLAEPGFGAGRTLNHNSQQRLAKRG